ncbi:molybdopterin-dependent oxidoreductase, partial [Clostridioides difficile]|uniref:molybdopterin-dependent oxidoreductase n=1 Tax=Clostridioides difficile TaxID=1496 RepID=UPI003F8D1473
IDECRVKEKDIRELVNLYVNKYSTINVGYGLQKYKNGGNTIRAIDALGAITGQIGFSGGGVNYANKVYPNVINADPYNSQAYGEDREFYVSNISKFIEESLKENIPIKMAVITKSNMLNQLPDLVELERVFSKIEFKVCFDMFMTDTATLCDLFIPCTNTLESEDIIYSSMTNPYITYNERAVKPKHEFMDEYYFFMELAKKMELRDYPFVSKKEYLEKVIEPLNRLDKSLDIEKLKNSYFTIHNPIAWKDKKFETPSGKYELYSERIRDLGISPIPVYISNKTRNFEDENR